MDKYLVFLFPDGTMYKLPWQVVGNHFCRHHQVETCTDADVLAHWHLMPFADVKDDLIKISTAPGLKPSQFLADANAEIMTTLQIEDLLTEKKEVSHE